MRRSAKLLLAKNKGEFPTSGWLSNFTSTLQRGAFLADTLSTMRTLITILLLTLPCLGQNIRDIDPSNSRLTVFAYKSGVFSFAAHDHEISAPILSGKIDASDQNSHVRLTVSAKEMSVVDPKASAKDRAEIQRDMHAKVLESERYPVIEFASTSITKTDADHWTVAGDLTLHGQTKPVKVLVAAANGRYRGEAKFKQSDFGIAPISVAGGTVKVKDEVKITFEIATK